MQRPKPCILTSGDKVVSSGLQTHTYAISDRFSGFSRKLFFRSCHMTYDEIDFFRHLTFAGLSKRDESLCMGMS
jgi:hypothetical protein